MLFNSLEFLCVFWPVCILSFYFVARRHRALCVPHLIIASLVFYGFWEVHYLLLLVGSVAFNGILGKRLLKNQSKPLLAAGVAVNLGIIGYFKYADFFLDNINAVFGYGFSHLDIILPLGISFFTFQQISYLVECRRRNVEDRGFLNYALFVTFFPQLIAGPIVRFNEISEQLASKTFGKANWPMIATGLVVFSIGLSKKVLLADSLARIATPVFTKFDWGIAVSMAEAWVGILAYSFQIYFDFSGYSDMAIGLALMLGLVLPVNFMSPYKARNIIDFWRRWHITLSRFLKDYLYIPLGGNRQSKTRRYMNLGIVMLLGGLWHGASWNFVIWGGLHGSYLMINHAFGAVKQRINRPVSIPCLANSASQRAEKEGNKEGLILHNAKSSEHQASESQSSTAKAPPNNELCKIYNLRFLLRVLNVPLTFLAVAVAWVFFRAETLDGAFLMLSTMAGMQDAGMLPQEPVLMFARIAFLLIPCFVIVWFLPNSMEIMKKTEEQITSPDVPLVLRFKTVCAGVVLSLSLFMIFSGAYSEFIYFQF